MHCARGDPKRVPELRQDILNFSFQTTYKDFSLRKNIHDSSYLFPFMAYLLTAVKMHNDSDLNNHLLKSLNYFLFMHLELYYSHSCYTFLDAILCNQPLWHPPTLRRILDRQGPADSEYAYLSNPIYDRRFRVHNRIDRELIYDSYMRLLFYFLNDPTRTQNYAQDGKKRAILALHCLKYTCNHSRPPTQLRGCKGHRERRKYSPWVWRKTVRPRVQRHEKWWMELRTNRIMLRSLRHRLSKKQMHTRQLQLFNRALVWTSKLLGRSGYLEELVQFVQRGSFAMQSILFRRSARVANNAIDEYLMTWGLNRS
ncbi:hypothetical protein GALMADRAFT_213155 [Galerina marginata CBS 339.88]|uniref:Uncharacterized protein n=1 Tax=Galerina marginata (strain CBS 339.88) TaxID=685588 RepID=A0A067SNW1_GALM3|nr:hypothetical protein GALMADRAFT_213155 [Galerina marginata CBS 339.88]